MQHSSSARIGKTIGSFELFHGKHHNIPGGKDRVGSPRHIRRASARMPVTAAAIVLLSAGIVFAGKPGRILIPEEIKVSSSGYAFRNTPLANGIREPQILYESWASRYLPGRPEAHWVEFSFKAPVAVEAVAVHWYTERGHFASSQSYKIQAWADGGYTDIVEVTDNPPVRRNLHTFDKVETDRIRILQPPGGGPAFRSNIMWVAEVEIYDYPRRESGFGTPADKEQLRRVREAGRDRTIGIFRSGRRSLALSKTLQEEGWRTHFLYYLDKRELQMCSIVAIVDRRHIPNREKLLRYMHNGGSVLFLHDACGRAGGGSLLPDLWTFEGMGEGELEIVDSGHPISAGATERFSPMYGDHARLRAGRRGTSIVRDSEGYDVVVAGRVGRGKAVAIGHYPGMSSGGTDWSEFVAMPPEGTELALLTNSIRWLAQDTGLRETWRKSLALRRALRREQPPLQPIFENVTKACGLSAFAYGKGVTMADINGNGRLDFFATLCIPSRWPWAAIDAPYHNLLYRNDGDWKFTEIAVEAGVDRPPGIGAAFGDFNGDGHLDLFVNYLPEMGSPGRGKMFFGDGRGAFRDVTDESGLGDVGHTAIAVIADVNNNGYLDLYLVGFRAENKLYINLGDGTFDERTQAYGLAGLGSEGASGYGGTLSVALADLDHSGYVDLIVFSDGGMRIFRNEGGERFEEVTDYMGEGNPPVQGSSLGLTLGDINNNGYLDVYISGPHTLLRNEGGMRFTDITYEAGLGPRSNYRNIHPYGPKFVDWNNSGHLDLFLATGAHDSFAFQNNGDGSFTEVTGAIGLDVHAVHGFNFGDLDGNGNLDFYATAWANHPTALLRNIQSEGNSLTIDVRGRQSNTSGIGAKIWVYEELQDGQRRLRGYREVMSGGESMYAGAILQQHVGLGPDDGIFTVEALFPVSGERVKLTGLRPLENVVIEEPERRD